MLEIDPAPSWLPNHCNAIEPFFSKGQLLDNATFHGSISRRLHPDRKARIPGGIEMRGEVVRWMEDTAVGSDLIVKALIRMQGHINYPPLTLRVVEVPKLNMVKYQTRRPFRVASGFIV